MIHAGNNAKPSTPTGSDRAQANDRLIHRAQLAACFMLGALVMLVLTSPPFAARRSSPSVSLGRSSDESADASLASTRRMHPVELRRESSASAQSPRESETEPSDRSGDASIRLASENQQGPPADGASRLHKDSTIDRGSASSAIDAAQANTPDPAVTRDASSNDSPARKSENDSLPAADLAKKSAGPAKASEGVVAGDKNPTAAADKASEDSKSSSTTAAAAETPPEPMGGKGSVEIGEPVSRGAAPARLPDNNEPKGPAIQNDKENDDVETPAPSATKPQAAPKPIIQPVAPTEAAPARPAYTPSAEQKALRGRLRGCLEYYYYEPISTADYSPWGCMHALISFGPDSHVWNSGVPLNAVGFLAYNGRAKGLRLFELDEHGQLSPKLGIGLQGHAGQFLAMLAQSHVRSDFGLRVEGRDFTVTDLIAREQATCRVKTELTFKLIGLVHYLDTDTKWKNDQGEDWDIPKMIREELAQPIVGATCGGNHRLTGFTYAVRKREKEGKPMDGQWARAKKYLEDYQAYIFKLQNPDGSFSTNWYAGRGDWGGADRKIETTGHMLEWLVATIPDERLNDPRVLAAVECLTDIMLDGRGKKWEIGPRGHALHALVLYEQRVFGERPGQRRLEFARRTGSRME